MRRSRLVEKTNKKFLEEIEKHRLEEKDDLQKIQEEQKTILKELENRGFEKKAEQLNN